ncbi:hypothetical protein HKX48_004180 [Thoreauomyces humboldtii]|nr:hypothetical protein HKX48_004180 [Thoreauomyces humboldtii]
MADVSFPPMSTPVATAEQQVRDIINSQFPSRVSLASAPQFLATARAERDALLLQSTHQAKTAPDKIVKIVAATKAAQEELKRLQDQRARLEERAAARPQNPKVFATLAAAQQKLQKLNSAKDYVETLIKAEALSTTVETASTRDVKAALTAYEQLRALRTAAVSDVVGPTAPDGKQHHLLRYVEDVTDRAYLLIRSNLSSKLEEQLDALEWPKPIDPARSLQEEKMAPFRETFGNLLLLQHPKEARGSEIVALLPIEVLLQAPILHFKYHFQGDRPTNRLDKPEWPFTKVLSILRDHSVFLCGPVQALLDEYGYKSRDAKNEFIHGLLAAVMHKLRMDAPKLLEDPRLFSHAIKETLSFDKALREVHLYVQPGERWKGCINVFTEQPEWFDQWIVMEFSAAKNKFEDAVEADEAWEFADEAIADMDELRLTQSAELFIKILETVTDRYRLLPDLVHKLSFFNELQLPLLEDYLQWIRNGIKKHNSTFHPINTPGAHLPSKSDRLQMLCRYISSLHCVSTMLREWGEQPFFVDFWEEIQSQSEEAATHNASAALFDEVVAAYDKCVTRLRATILEEIMQEFTESMWQYDRRRNWIMATQDDGVPIDDISPELCATLDALSHFLPRLQANLPHSIFQHIVCDLAFRIDEHFWLRIILKSRFNTTGARQFRQDVEKGLINGLFRRWHRKPEALLRRTHESVILLTLPMESSPTESSVSTGATLVALVELLLDGDDKAISDALESIGVFRLSTTDVQDVVNRLLEVEALFNQLLQDE